MSQNNLDLFELIIQFYTTHDVSILQNHLDFIHIDLPRARTIFKDFMEDDIENFIFGNLTGLYFYFPNISRF